MPEELAPDICVIGGGPGGIALAVAAANRNVPVVLIEKDRLGGASLRIGSIPTKAFIAAANQYETLRRGPAVGVTGAPLQVNFAKVHEHVHAVGDAVAPNVSAERLSALGVTVVKGEGRFVDRRTVVAGEATIRARRFVIATGASPAPPPLPGLATIDALTLEELFDTPRKPSHLIVLGAGPRGLELAQAYNRLGVDATVIDTEKALDGADPELVAIVLDRLRAEGIRVRDGVQITSFAKRRGAIRVMLGEGDEAVAVDGSHLLIATGRAPNVAGLGLDAAGIEHDGSGIVVDRRLRTSNRRVYAIGDVVAGPASTNRAEDQAATVLRSILYRVPRQEAAGAAPFVTFTDPQLAVVGLGEEEARRDHKNLRILRLPFAENDLAQAERTTAGAIKVIVTDRGRILGAAAVGTNAGEVIALYSLAISSGLDIRAMQSFAPPYPSRAEIAKRVALTYDGPGPTPVRGKRIIEFLRKFG